MEYKGKLLLIDDNRDLLDYLSDFFMIYNYEVITAETKKDGLCHFETFRPEIVITDMKLPDGNGNEIVKHIKSSAPDVPIIVITGYSDQEEIVAALKNGAVDILKKPFRSKDLKFLINKVETLFRRKQKEVNSGFIKWEKSEYRLENDIFSIPSMIDLIFSRVTHVVDNTSFLRIGLQEILVNAIEHGNLGITFEEKQSLLDKKDNYNKYLQERAQQEPYKDTFVQILVFTTPEYLKIIIRDQGQGFDLYELPDLNDPENFLRESGKGILMAMNAFDKIEYNELGNEVSLWKYAEDISDEKHEPHEKEDFEVFSRLKEYSRFKDEFDFELNLAAEFQDTFLPKKDDIMDFPELESAYIYIPLLKVSGDFIDISRLDEGIYGYFITDISGHGVAAALICSMLKVFFSLYAKDVLSPQLLFEMLNQEFYNYLNAGEYFTSFYGIYFAEERKFVYTSANHPPPLLYKAKTREIVPLDTEGFFVGIFQEAVFEEKEVYLEPGDRILFYTDGIIEAQNRNNEIFGVERLKKMYQEEKDVSIGDMISIIKNRVYFFSDNHIEDDVTIAAIEVK